MLAYYTNNQDYVRITSLPLDISAVEAIMNNMGKLITSKNKSYFYTTQTMYNKSLDLMLYTVLIFNGTYTGLRPVTRSLDSSLICTWTNGWVNNRDADDLLIMTSL